MDAVPVSAVASLSSSLLLLAASANYILVDRGRSINSVNLSVMRGRCDV